MNSRAAVAAVVVAAALATALVIARYSAPHKVMTEEDKAAIAKIAERYRRDEQTVATKVDAWNTAKNKSVSAFNATAIAKVQELGAAIETGTWKVLKSYLEDSVASAMDAQGAAATVHGLGAATLAYVPLSVPDMVMPTHEPYITWEEWEPGGWPYAEYAESQRPAFTDSEGELWLAESFAPQPWAPPEAITVDGVVAADGGKFQLSIGTGDGAWRLGLDDLLGVPGLIDPESPIANDGSAVIAEKELR